MRVSLPGVKIIIKVLFIFSSSGLITAQKTNVGATPGKADLSKGKKSAPEYLGDSLTIRKYGIISDSIKSYLPEGAKPPLELIKTLMYKYRDAMVHAIQEGH